VVWAIICLAIWFRFVVNRTVTKVAHSMTGGLSLIDNIDSVMNNLDRLSMNQRAFLYTGDERFAGQVAESIMAISNNLESLKQISLNDESLERKVTNCLIVLIGRWIPSRKRTSSSNTSGLAPQSHCSTPMTLSGMRKSKRSR
jgi:CHASE3 domain sensor protein